jgi:hypothetical protein
MALLMALTSLEEKCTQIEVPGERAAMKIACHVVRSLGLNRGFEGDAIAEAFEAAFEVGDGSGLADLVERFAEFAIGLAFGEHVIGGNGDFVSDGERRAKAPRRALRRWKLSLR